MEDLQPYVCTHQNCDLGDQFFSNRDEWYEHDSQYHRITWFCNTENHPDYDNQRDFINHMRKDHDTMFDESRFVKVQAMFQQPSRRADGTCNLCMRECRKLKYHVSRHLQQMALFALPRVNETAGSGEAEHRTVSSKHSAKDTCDEEDDDDDYRSSEASSKAHNDEVKQERDSHPFNPQDDGVVTSWQSGLQMLVGHSNLVSVVAFSPDGKTLASASYDQMAMLWDASLGVVLQMFEGHSDSVNALAFALDGETLASASGDRTVKLWSTVSGTALVTLKGHSDSVNALAFAPDGKTLASASGDETVRLWDTVSGVALQMLEGHSDSVNALAFAPDGKTLASASGDRTVRLWDTVSGAALAPLEGPFGLVQAIAFSPDYRRAWGDTKNQVWDDITNKFSDAREGRSAEPPLMLSNDERTKRPETPPCPTCLIPFTRDPDFVERGALLDQIDHKCAVPGSWTALIGLGGVG